MTELQEDVTHAISKGIGIMADGSCGSLTYYDTPVRGEHGWRIHLPADPRFETL